MSSFPERPLASMLPLVHATAYGLTSYAVTPQPRDLSTMETNPDPQPISTALALVPLVSLETTRQSIFVSSLGGYTELVVDTTHSPTPSIRNLSSTIVIFTRTRDKIVPPAHSFDSTTFMSSSCKGWPVPASTGTSRGFVRVVLCASLLNTPRVGG